MKKKNKNHQLLTGRLTNMTEGGIRHGSHNK